MKTVLLHILGVPLISKKLISCNVLGAKICHEGKLADLTPGGTDWSGLSRFREVIVPLNSVLGLYKRVLILVLTSAFFLKEV